jgi:hypothetical protein
MSGHSPDSGRHRLVAPTSPDSTARSLRPIVDRPLAMAVRMIAEPPTKLASPCARAYCAVVPFAGPPKTAKAPLNRAFALTLDALTSKALERAKGSEPSTQLGKLPFYFALQELSARAAPNRGTRPRSVWLAVRDVGRPRRAAGDAARGTSRGTGSSLRAAPLAHAACTSRPPRFSPARPSAARRSR